MILRALFYQIPPVYFTKNGPYGSLLVLRWLMGEAGEHPVASQNLPGVQAHRRFFLCKFYPGVRSFCSKI